MTGQTMKDDYLRKFLVHLRTEVKNWSLEEAVSELKLEGDVSTLCRIENGVTKSPRPETKRRIARGYGFDGGWQALTKAAREHTARVTFETLTAKDRGNPEKYERVELLTAPDMTYARLCSVLKKVNRQPGVKTWLLGALHGVDDERRNPAHPEEECASKRDFDGLLRTYALQHGEKRWRIKMLFNVVTRERFLRLEGLIKDIAPAVDFEIKFVVVRNTLSMLSPCIIGHADCFVGVQDPSYYRVQSAFHLHGWQSVTLLRTHWDMIWDRAKWLRHATGVAAPALQELRQKYKVSAGGDN